MEKRSFVSKALHILPKIFTYLPIFFVLLWYSIRYRTSPAILIRANPAFPYGGLICSKTKIFERFQKNRKEYERFFLKTLGVFIKDPVLQRIENAKKFIKENDFSYPVIFKPDQAIAGVGLKCIQDEQELLRSIHKMRKDYVLQEYLDRPYELGVFFVKDPENSHGRIRSITQRHILKPARGNAKLVTPENNVSYKDESYLIDPLLEKTFNDIADIDGFYFGRFDIRVQDIHNFITKGEGFKIMEVNVGAHSMALQAFDRRYNIFQRYAILSKQLQLAFAIARKNLHSPHDVLQEYKESKRVITKFIRKNVEIFNSLNKGE